VGEVVASTAIAAALTAPPRPARVLGASPAALYLGIEGEGAEPEVVAVVAAWAVHLPVAIAVPGRAPAVVDAGAVRVGGGGVDVGGSWVRPARWLDPRPCLPGGVVGPRLAEAEARLAGLATHPAASVAAGLAGGDPGPALEQLGRGPGLTPAGDDVVAGAAAALALLGGLDAAAATAVLAEAGRATTALSAALLRCAVRGQVVPQAAGLLLALCGSGAVEPALRGLLAVGDTSGTALTLGICAGARVAQLRRQRLEGGTGRAGRLRRGGM
jgi:hypothetical protein